MKMSCILLGIGYLSLTAIFTVSVWAGGLAPDAAIDAIDKYLWGLIASTGVVVGIGVWR